MVMILQLPRPGINEAADGHKGNNINATTSTITTHYSGELFCFKKT